MGVENIDMDKWEIIKDVVLTEDSNSIVITTDNNGNPIKLKRVAFNVNAEPSASTTQAVNAYVRMEPNKYIMTIVSVVRATATIISGGFDVIAVGDPNGSMAFVYNVASANIYWNNKPVLADAKTYSEYFELYASGTAKFGAGTRLQLLGVRA